MSLMIQGMNMPKQSIVKTDIGKLKLWAIRDERFNRYNQFGAAVVPCDLRFAHDGTITIDILGKKYPVVDVPSHHGDLISRDKLIRTLHKEFCYNKVSDNCLRKGGCLNCMLYAIFSYLEEAPVVIEADKA